ncbi:glycosyltransferase family 2 protein [Cellulomonas telluris]|uniref:glycosyltransferase family 2 protein n=1 Tax=Cellulomonas telluris TaxID=2306636 RepID=UPI0010A7E44B|nr:glycosyltransferase family 2 protein [Cellulomonas telluris]
MTVPQVAVVVVTYNAAEWVDRCLRALLEDARPRTPFEVVVLDNASDAPTREVLARWADRVRLHLGSENIGFGRGCNAAVAMTDAERVVLLNPDAVVREGCIDALVEALDAYPQAGLVGGRTLRPDGSVDPSSCWGRPTLWSWFCFATGLSTAFRRSRVLDPESLGRWDRGTAQEVDIVTGCLLAFERTTWDKLGGFDERFFMYAEDADLSLRAAELGLRPRITPDAVAVHAVGASSARAHKLRLLMTGKATLARLHWAPWRARTGVAMLLAGAAVRGLGERALGRTPSWGTLVSDRSWTRGWPA